MAEEVADPRPARAVSLEELTHQGIDALCEGTLAARVEYARDCRQQVQALAHQLLDVWQTERTMHAAWEKRAYEAEAALLAGAVPAAAPLRAQRDALLDALKAIAENGIDSNHYANRTARAAIAKAVGAVPAAPLDQADDDPNVVMAVTAIVREADQEFQRVGGSSRHWVRECFLPVLNRCGWQVVRAQAVPEECR